MIIDGADIRHATLEDGEWVGDENPHEREDGLLHAHISWESRDCDGVTSGTSDLWPHLMTPGRPWNDFNDPYWDYSFIDYVTASCVRWTSLEDDAIGKLQVRRLSANHEELSLEWFGHTDEGFEHKVAVLCRDAACEPEPMSYRDHRAESMGY